MFLLTLPFLTVAHNSLKLAPTNVFVVFFKETRLNRIRIDYQQDTKFIYKFLTSKWHPDIAKWVLFERFCTLFSL